LSRHVVEQASQKFVHWRGPVRRADRVLLDEGHGGAGLKRKTPPRRVRLPSVARLLNVGKHFRIDGGIVRARDARCKRRRRGYLSNAAARQHFGL